MSTIVYDNSADPWQIGEPSAVLTFPPAGIAGEEISKFVSTEVYPIFQTERERLGKLEAWGTGQQPTARHHPNANREKLVLQRFSRNPIIPFMISTFAQQMIVDGFRRDGATENEDAWDAWQANNMPAQQLTLNRTTMICGYSYLRVTRGVQPLTDLQMARMCVVDPQNAFGIYTDPYGDEYPQYLLERRFDGKFWWWTADDYTILGKNGNDWAFIETVPHDYGVVPFVRYVNQIDAKGRTWGEVEPVVEIAARIDKTVLDRLLVQHFNSFKVRYATGLEQPDTEEKGAAAALQLTQGTLMISSNEQAKFGTMDETLMQPFIAAYQSDLETFLMVTQLPPDLAGQVANIAADALEGARRSTYQKLAEKQTMFGQSHAQALRLAAAIEGRSDEAADFSARVHWQSVEVRSLAQFADAWGKICLQLGYPKQLVWPLIPGIDQSDVEAAKEQYFEDSGEEGKLNKYLRELGIPPVGNTPGDTGPGGTTSVQNQPKVNESQTVV